MTTGTKASGALGNLAQLVEQLGDVPLDRIRTRPAPGTATEQDVLAEREGPERRLCELVDGVLVEKAVGTAESVLAGIILYRLWMYLEEKDLGQALGADGFLRLMPGLVRIPDVSFVAWDHWPKLKAGTGRIADAYPDLMIEVLSKSNTRKEIDRKLRECFLAGTRLAWIIQPTTQTAQVYTSPTDYQRVGKNGTLDASPVLPGFLLSLKALFAKADRDPPGGR